MSYIIKRNNKRYNSKLFASYEQARSYIRKKLRNAPLDKINPNEVGSDIGFIFYSNPSHSKYGFSIQRTC